MARSGAYAEAVDIAGGERALKANLVAAYNDLGLWSLVAAQFGVTRVTIIGWRKKLGIKTETKVR